MRLQFVTGANGAFFPTLMVLLQSFAEQIGGTLPYVCDYGLTANQREFLRRRGLLLERLPALGPPMSPLREKAILHEYFRHTGLDATDNVIWLDGDLTIVRCSRADIEAIVTSMVEHEIEIAACPQGTMAEVLDVFRRQGTAGAPFAELLAESAIDTAKPYYSTGIFFCRSANFLERWSKISRRAPDQPVLDQNLFNVVAHRGTRPVLPLEIDLWQAQGETLGRLLIETDAAHGRSFALLDGRVVKILHATSTTTRDLFIAPASFSVADLVLEGAFKLLRREPLLDLQLGLLGRFLIQHRTELLELGLCRPGPAVDGYVLRSLAPRRGRS